MKRNTQEEGRVLSDLTVFVKGEALPKVIEELGKLLRPNIECKITADFMGSLQVLAENMCQLLLHRASMFAAYRYGEYDSKIANRSLYVSDFESAWQTIVQDSRKQEN
jgi:hypothetical protein